MTLHPPFEIGPRLAPALRIADSNGTAWLTFDKGFVIDLPDGSEHPILDYQPGAGGRDLPAMFGDILAFLGACAESRSYAERKGKSAMDGENSSLFNEAVGAWAQQMSDELSMIQCEIEESEAELIED